MNIPQSKITRSLKWHSQDLELTAFPQIHPWLLYRAPELQNLFQLISRTRLLQHLFNANFRRISKSLATMHNLWKIMPNCCVNTKKKSAFAAKILIALYSWLHQFCLKLFSVKNYHYKFFWVLFLSAFLGSESSIGLPKQGALKRGKEKAQTVTNTRNNKTHFR